MVAHVSRKPILAISASGQENGVIVTVGYKEGTMRDDFGWYEIEKKNGQWVIIISADSLFPPMVEWGFGDQ